MTQDVSKQENSPVSRAASGSRRRYRRRAFGDCPLRDQAAGRQEAAVNPACPEASAKAARLQPLVHGEIAALSLAKAPKPLPELAFKAADGTPVGLADFKGREVLLNLWATWCVPCRRKCPRLTVCRARLAPRIFSWLR